VSWTIVVLTVLAAYYIYSQQEIHPFYTTTTMTEGDSSSSSSKKYKAIVLGATGGTGQAVLKELLRGDRWSQVTTVGRRNLSENALQGVPNVQKLKQITVNTDNNGYEAVKEEFQGYDAVFSCIGTTREQAGSQEAYRKIDHDLPVQAATYAKEFKTPLFSIITSMGSNRDSFFSYPKLKGEIEEDLKAVNLPLLSIMRPGFLMVNREGKRNMEQVAQSLYGGLSHVLPLKWKGIPVDSVAVAMRRDAERKLDAYDGSSNSSHETFENDVIFRMAV